MAKDYYGKRNSARRKSGASKQLLLVLVCFLFGYLSASIFDFTSLSGWVNAQLLALHVQPAATKPVVKQAQLPTPKFEFYTLLASGNSNTSAAVASTAAAIALPTTSPVSSSATKSPPVTAPLAIVVTAKQSTTPVAINKNAYLVQIAAFKSRPEAERMKASFALKGFVVGIAIVNQQQISWYRVILGPFASRTEAEKAQVAVARSEHIVGMIRKMDA